MTNRAIIVGFEHSEVSRINDLVENLKKRVKLAEVIGVIVDKDNFTNILSLAFSDGIKNLMVVPLSIPENVEKVLTLKQEIQAFSDNCTMNIELIDDFVTELVLEDMIWEAIISRVTNKNMLPELGVDIELLSHKIIDSKLQNITNMNSDEKIVARRIIHSTADYSFAHTLRFSPNAVVNGIEALKSKKTIICDVNMLKTAMTKVESEVICLISDPEVVALSKEKKCTRAAAAMMSLKDKLDGAVVVIGNAPTAIWQLLKMDVKPALIVGLPVGFVGARESKLELINSDFEYIANTTPRGGSPAAAAALNALALLAKKK